MSPAEQPNAFHVRLTAARDRVDVIEFEAFARHAAMARVTDERALALIALPYRALDCRRDVTRVHDGAWLIGAWLTGRTKLLFLELHDQLVQRAVDDLLEIARGQRMAEQRSGVLQFVVSVLRDR